MYSLNCEAFIDVFNIFVLIILIDLTKSCSYENAQKDKQNNDNNNNDFSNESFENDESLPLDYGDYLADYSFKPIKEIKTTVKPVHEHIDKNLKFQEHVNMKENLQLKNVGKFRKKNIEHKFTLLLCNICSEYPIFFFRFTSLT